MSEVNARADCAQINWTLFLFRVLNVFRVSLLLSLSLSAQIFGYASHYTKKIKTTIKRYVCERFFCASRLAPVYSMCFC